MSTFEQRLSAEVTRRRFLQGSALVGFSAFLAACSGGGGGGTTAPGGSASPGASGGDGEVIGPLNFANWPAYIDLNEDETASPTLVDFETQYGIEVNYVEDIQDNEDFVATIAPQLQAGLDTGWDLIAPTDYMAARLIKSGWIEEINPANIPTALANVRDEHKGLEWDPDFKYHMPWQTYATGVGYNVASTGRDLTSIAELLETPEFAGKVTLLSGYQDTFSLTGLLLRERGVISNDPEQMTTEDGQKIYDYLKPIVDSGYVRAFTGNEYLQDFGSGDTWVAFVFSGDLASSGGDDDRFVFPTEGSVAATDVMLIPKGAQHKRAAEAMIDFVYDVDRAARLAAWIYYVSPVKGVAEKIKESDAALAENELLFPPEEVTSKQHGYPIVDDATDLALQDLAAKLEGS